ncbi:MULTISPECIES: cysteine hydrolase family protein [unclassified Saccharibacter]|uniref:cysteine hydrolase family protein n=1 Tax=unclassified Saccharibacter TaxID=2648722 RepID=UPI0019275D36|nr:MULTISPECIES: isochorismatase family cysteine hydrolase [unclassified Saccharibacter]
MTQLSFSPQKTALLLMDFQNFILDNFISPEAAKHVTQKAEQALSTARQAGLPVIYVTVSFRAGYPEVSSRNALFSTIRDNNLAPANSDAVRIHSALTPRDDEPVIRKHRVSAFTGTDLDMILRAQGIEQVILAGVATSHVVLSTFNSAFDLDYSPMVLHDACADSDAEAHRFLTETLLPKSGAIFSVQEFEKAVTA